MRLFCCSSLLLLVSLPATYAATPPSPPRDTAALFAQPEALALDAGADRVVTRGGRVSIRWNDDLLGDLGMPRRRSGKASESTLSLLLSKDSFVEADLSGRALLPFAAGRGSLRGGFTFDLRAGGKLKWRNPSFVVRPGAALRLDLVTADGAALFYIDSLMFALSADGTAIELRSSDLRIAPQLAERLGHREYAGLAVAEVQGRLPLASRLRAAQPKACGDPNWPGEMVPGVPGAVYRADVFMTTFNGQVMRCRATPAGGSCDGPTATSNGQIVIAPSSTLRNNVNNGAAIATVPGDPLGTSAALYTADVEWETKFRNEIPNGPYAQPDQHPFLIWNLYRIDASGAITQIGRSGVKHAFLTINSGCAAGENCSPYILGRQCGDTYGTNNNDSPNDLGPRRELIPARGQWGRCRSIFDSNCDGLQNTSGNGEYDQRLIVSESDVTAALHPGASWMFESWYLVRDDIDIYNTMATLPVSVNWIGSAWTVSNGAPFRLGSAVDRWVAAAPAGVTARVDALDMPEGHAKFGVRVRDLGNGGWRYEYVLMNFDFARAVTAGMEPNMEVLRNHGFSALHLPLGAGVVATDLVVADGDRAADNDWVATQVDGLLSVRAPSQSASLDWGTMLRIGFTTTAPAVASSVEIEITEAGAPAASTLSTVGPRAAAPPFANGFE